MGPPYDAREIYIWHVDYSCYNFEVEEYEEPHPVWWIDMLGLPSFSFTWPTATAVRSLIDSQNGLNIGSTNLEF